MKEKLNELLMDFNKINKECDELYHKVASKDGDFRQRLFYLLHSL